MTYRKLLRPSLILRTTARLGGLLLAIGLLGVALGPANAAQSTQELDLMIVIDQSTSMCCAPIQNDLGAERMRFARLFVSMLGVDQLDTDYRLGFVYFGTDASLVAPLSPVASNADRDALFAKVGPDEEAPNMGWTDITQALKAARAELDRNGRPTAKQAIVLLTDGEPRLSSWPSDNFEQNQDAYIQDLRNYIDGQWGNDIPLFTVAFSQEAFRQDPDNQIYKNLYEELAVRTSAPADHGYQEADEAGDLGQIYFNIISSLLGIEDMVLEPPVPVPVVKQFEVESDLAQVIFVVLKDNPDITTTITDPSGNIVVCAPDGDPNVACVRSQREESISITSPQTGTWSVSLNGQGFIQFQAVPFRLDQQYEFQLVSPLRGHPAGKPLEISFRVTERETKQAASAENVTVKVVYPSQAETAPLAAYSVGDGRYTAILEDTHETGDYKLLFAGDVAEGTLHNEGIIKVLPVQWIRIEQPTGSGFPANQPVDVVAQLMWVDKPLTQIDPSWRLTATANLEGPGGNVQATKPLEPAADGTFHGQFDAPGTEGEHIVEVSLLIETAGGEPFTDETRGRFTVGAAVTPTPPPTDVPTVTPAPTATPGPTPVPPPPPPPPDLKAIAGGGGLLLLVVGGVIGGLYFARLPKLSGDVNVEGPSANFYSLKGSKPAVIGSDPKSKIPLIDGDVAPRHAEFRPRGKGVSLIPLVEGGGEYASVQVKGQDEKSFHEVFGSHDLRHDDLIKIGGNTLHYSNPALGGGFDEIDAGGGDDYQFDDDGDYS